MRFSFWRNDDIQRDNIKLALRLCVTLFDECDLYLCFRILKSFFIGNLFLLCARYVDPS
jgi:hypothetical protein